MQLTQLKKQEATDKNIFSQVWFKYFPYWPLFVMALIISIAGAWAYLRYKTTPLYESAATILIKDEKKGESDAKMLETINQLSAKKIIENETEVLRSKALMQEVVNKLHLYAPVFQEGKIKPMSAYSFSPVRIEVKNPDSIYGTGKVFFSYDEAKKQVIIDNKYFPAGEWVATQYGELRFSPQKQDYKPVKPLYFVLVRPQWAAVSYSDALTVSTVSKLSSVIKLKMLDEVPKRGEDILNTLIEMYEKASINDKNKLAANTLAFVNERLAVLGKDLSTIEKTIEQYKESQGGVDISSQGTLFLGSVNTVDQKLGDVNMQLAVLNHIEKDIKSKDKSGSIVPSTVGVTDPLLTDLLTKLNNYELQREALRKTTGENNSLVISLTDQIAKMRPSILENINSQKTSLEESKTNLNQMNNKFSTLLNSIPKKERDLLEISREQSVKSSIYNFLLQKKEETDISLSSSITDSRTVDHAQSSLGPVAPNPKMIYAMAIILGLGIALGLVTLNELLKRTILFRHEIESYTSVPVIGEIVYEKTEAPLVIGEGKRTFIAEQFRNLRTSLNYIGLKKDKKKLLVTSTVSGEGKSFIVANLGLSLALAGKKVVVLEFDLSNPTLAEKLKLTADRGLTDYINGHLEPEEIVRRSPVHENLFIIPAGPLPDNPSELIMSDKVPELLEYLSEIFDFIILDSAPVGLLTDAYILSDYCDATLYVVRHRHTRKVSIQRLDENNRINSLKNIAIVFNGIRSRGFNKNGYGYGYGYGYIFNETGKKIKRRDAAQAGKV
jgi:tyrosine-protein kinase Etk/Wzc